MKYGRDTSDMVRACDYDQGEVDIGFKCHNVKLLKKISIWLDCNMNLERVHLRYVDLMCSLFLSKQLDFTLN